MAVRTSNVPSVNIMTDKINGTYVKVDDTKQHLKLFWVDAYVSSNGSCLCDNPDPKKPPSVINCPSATKTTTITITNNDDTTAKLKFDVKFGGSSTGLKDRLFFLPINIKNIAITTGISSGCDCQTLCSGNPAGGN